MANRLGELMQRQSDADYMQSLSNVRRNRLPSNLRDDGRGQALEAPMFSPDDLIGSGLITKAALMAKGLIPLAGVGMVKSVGKKNALMDIVGKPSKLLPPERPVYQGEHQAPLKDSGAPLHDVTGGGSFYPDDIYSANGLRYYGDGNDIPDRESFNVLMSAKGKPKEMVTAYRAVPNDNAAIEKEIKALNSSIGFRNQHPFFNTKDDTHRAFKEKYKDSGMSYDAIEQQVLKDMESRVAELTANKSPKQTINHGDWVTLSKQYAKEHGQSALNDNYKIITKKIPARRLFTNGDSFNEFGYDATVPAIAGGALGLNALSGLYQDEYQ